MIALASADLPGVALVVAAVGPTLAVVLAWWEQHRAANKKEEIAQTERVAARQTANDKLDDIKANQDVIAGKTDEVHAIVNGQRAALLARVAELEREIAQLKARKRAGS